MSITNKRKLSSATYDIFLSFRGKDTRNGFTSHLFRALKQQGYCVFHDTLLERAQLVSSGLLEAIAHSKLSIVVFSRNYADSRWCLDELVKILDCRRSRSSQQIVLPVFYHVDPSHVRNQTGDYAAAFIKHERDHKLVIEHVNKWKEALNEAGNLSGLHLQNDSNGNEADFVQKIVEQVAESLDEPCLHVADYPVGIESCVQELKSLLSLGTDDVRVVAIWGMGGIGKTTIAKAVFNNIYKRFQGSCFLEDVRATARQQDGRIVLQQRLISGVLRQKLKRIPDIHSSHHGIEVIKQKLWCRKVLVVLDDVDSLDQLKHLAISRSLLPPGSRVIITTRDIYCVSSPDVDAKVYEPQPLDSNLSLDLFNHYAFGDHGPKKGYEELSQKVVEYAGGLPLVLETLGPYMRGLGTVDLWRQALDRLRVIPPLNVQEKLKLSFDSLSMREKELFLDIVGFFTGELPSFMFEVMAEAAPSHYPVFEFKVLLERCLVKIGTGGKIWVHDMLRDMGRAIVREESLNGCRRLWDPDDIFSILKGSLQKGSEAIECIILDLPDSNEKYMEIKAFAKMSKLRLIHVRHLNLVGTYRGMLSLDKLKWLSWYGFPLTSIPPNLDMQSLVALDMRESKLRQLWKGIKVLNKLRFLDVSNSYFLTSTPDLSGAVNLVQIRLCNCKSLVELHPSIQHLHQLVVLDLTGCCKLFVRAGFEESFSNIWHLFSSMLTWNSPKKSPTSSFLLTSFHPGLSSLTELSLSNCNLTHLPVEIGNLVSLVQLRLDNNNFSSIPASIKNLQHLQLLNVEHCHELKSIDHLPNDLIFLGVGRCRSLEAIQVSSDSESRYLSIALGKDHGKVINTIITNQERPPHFPNINIHVFEPENENIPAWFNYQGLGPFISFVAPKHPNTTSMRGWIICTTIATRPIISPLVFGNVYNKTKDRLYTVYIGFSLFEEKRIISYVEHSKHGILMEEGDEIEILFLGTSSNSMCGLRIVYDVETDDQLMIQYSPWINIDKYYDDDKISDDEEVGYAVEYEYLSPVMIGWIKPMLHDLRHFDSAFFFELVQDIFRGGTRVQNEHRPVYRFANSFYTWYVQTSTGRPSFYLNFSEEASLD